MLKTVLAVAIAAAGLGSFSQAFADEFESAKDSKLGIAPASDEGELAIARFRVAEGLKVELWAAEPLLANPVAIGTDEKGRVYVCETFRWNNGVLDIRGHMDWLGDDLACRTVEDRAAMLKRKYGPNIRTMKEYSDQIQVLEDTKGTGKADKSTTFATIPATPEDGPVSSVRPMRGNVYVADVPSLYLFRDTTGSGKADSRKVLSTGYGVHISYSGHDFHGLRFGPDGKLYMSMGDRGLSVKTDQGVVDVPDMGSVLRCDADGSNLEVFATGLRNPQQLTFDQYGNLFTGDNNPDYGDPARWVYVCEGGDSGWRIGYQLDHNPVGGGPWMWEKLYEVSGKLNAAYIVPPVAVPKEAHLAGPSGVATYPGTGLSSHWKDHMFLCDFRGGANGSGVHAFKMKPKGAGFEMTDYEQFLWDVLATDIDFSPGGGAYICDWVTGWGKTGKGRIYRIFDPQAGALPIVAETKKLLADGFDQRKPQELALLLAHPDMRVRQEAQFTLAEKGEASIPVFVAVAAKNDNPLARLHAIWGLGQIGRKAPAAFAPLMPLAADKDDEVRAQVAKVLGDDHVSAAFDDLVKLLKDSSPRVRFFAAQGLGHRGRHEAVAPILTMLREADDKDPWLRHAGVMGLVGCNDHDALIAAAKDSSAAVRMGVLLAMRRLALPEVAEFLHDTDDRLVLESARAIYDVPIPAAFPQLGALAQDAKAKEPVLVRAISANFRLGTPAGAAALAKAGAQRDLPERWRVEALHDLGLWESPPAFDTLLHFFRPQPPRDLSVARNAASAVLTDILRDAPDKVRIAAIDLIDKLKIENGGILYELATSAQFPPAVRSQALETMASRSDPKLPDAVKTAFTGQDAAVRRTAIKCLGKVSGSAPQLIALLDAGSTQDRQAAFSALGSLQDPAVNVALGTWMDKLLAGQAAPELQLDILEAAGKRGTPPLAEKLKRYNESLSKSDPLAAYRVAMVGGDAEAGRKIFRERADAGCMRCHTAEGAGGIVGPKLDGLATRQTREYMLESVVSPNAKIAPGFESTTVKLADGKTVNGIVKEEKETQLTLIKSDGKTQKIAKKDIKSREHGLSAMPEGLANILSKHDLRDVVEFLASLK